MDAAGCHRFSARAGDVIVTAGHRIAPFEVESVLMLHEDVTEAVVVGVPTARRGIVPEVYVVLQRPGAEPAFGLAEDLKQMVRTRLPAYAVPSVVHVCRRAGRCTPGGHPCGGPRLRGASGQLVSPAVDAFLITIPPLVVYLAVGLVVGIESLGVPLPGEIVLVSAALLSSRHELDVRRGGSPWPRSAGAVIGDSIGYADRPPLRHGPVRLGRPGRCLGTSARHT